LMKSRRRTQPSAVRLKATPVFKAYQIRAAMSALGQKPTYALQQAMSALHPIATSIAFFGISALGQKRTFRIARVMSALPPKADITPRTTLYWSPPIIAFIGGYAAVPTTPAAVSTLQRFRRRIDRQIRAYLLVGSPRP